MNRYPQRPRALVVALALLSALQAYAQLGIRLETDRLKYVTYEPVHTTVTLRNYSGNTLVFGLDPKTQGHLDFAVAKQNAPPVRRLDDSANPVSGLVLGAGETKTLTLSLNTIYDMQEEGTYDVFAQVGHPQLENDFRSESVTVEIRHGTVQWKRSVGMPGQQQGGTIPSRQVSLLIFHDRDGDVYCLRVEDEDFVYRIVRLGRRVIGAAPQCDVDAISSIHVLFPLRPRLYVHQVYDYDVKLKQERHYVLEGAAPRFHRDPDVGRIMVVGARPAVRGVDFLYAEDASGAPQDVPAAVQPPAPLTRSETRRRGGFLRRLFRFGRE